MEHVLQLSKPTSLLKVPAGHAVHVAVKLEDKVDPVYPASQVAQTAEPAVLEVADEHFAQYVAPELGL